MIDYPNDLIVVPTSLNHLSAHSDLNHFNDFKYAGDKPYLISFLQQSSQLISMLELAV